MADYSEILSSVLHLVKKQVLKTIPSKGGDHDGGKKNFRLYTGDEIEDANKSFRLFDVVCTEDGPEATFVHLSARDYDVPMQIEIAYSDDRHENTVAFSDFDKIYWSVMTSDKSAINALGFSYFEFDKPTLDDVDDDEEFRFLRIPLICRATSQPTQIYPTWQDGITGTEYQDTSWSTQEFQDQPNG